MFCARLHRRWSRAHRGVGCVGHRSVVVLGPTLPPAPQVLSQPLLPWQPRVPPPVVPPLEVPPVAVDPHSELQDLLLGDLDLGRQELDVAVRGRDARGATWLGRLSTKGRARPRASVRRHGRGAGCWQGLCWPLVAKEKKQWCGVSPLEPREGCVDLIPIHV